MVVMQWFRRGLVGEGDVVVDAGSPGVVGGVRGRRWPRRSEVVGDGRAGPSSRSAEGGRGGSGREGPGEWGGGETKEARGAPYPLPASAPERWSEATRPCSDPVARIGEAGAARWVGWAGWLGGQLGRGPGERGFNFLFPFFY